jgi:hypothetical protein
MTTRLVDLPLAAEGASHGSPYQAGGGLRGVALSCAALAFGELAFSPGGGPLTLCLLAAAMSIAESLGDLLCHVRVAFMFFGGLLVSLSRPLGGAHGAQAGIPHPFAGLILTHSASLPTNTFADTRNARHDRNRPGSS